MNPTFSSHAKRHSIFSSVSGKILVASVASLLAVNASHALLLTFDMRAVSSGALAGSTSGNVTISNTHSVSYTPTASPTNIVFQLWGVFATSDANNKINTTSGAIFSSSTSGTITGALTGFNTPNFADTGTGATPGVSTEVSSQYPYIPGTSVLTAVTAPVANGVADGIADLGDLIANQATATKWFSVSSGASAFGNGLDSYLIGEFRLTLDANSSGGTTVGYTLRPRTSGSTGNKFFNNIVTANTARSLSYVGADSTNSVSNAFAFQSVVVSAVPEPSAFGMVMLGALGLVGFRRLGLRRTA